MELLAPSNNPTEYFNRATSNALKAAAIIFLITGHLFAFCINGENSILAHTGEWAVLIFLIVSAMGMTKSYGLKGCGKKFLFRRLAKIVFPLWLSLGLFYSLDFIILHKTYPWHQIALGFAGIIGKGPPNEPAWFVSFIIYLYLIFFLVSNVSAPKYLKCAAFIIISCGTSFLISRVPLLSRFFGGWRTYTAAYPLSICIMAYSGPVFKCLFRWYGRLRLGLIALCLALLLLYFTMSFGKTIYFIVCIAISVVFIDRIKSIPRILNFLGDHSFELYLVHFPFMVSYGLVRGRKPLIGYLIFYLVFIIITSIILKNASKYLNGIIFPLAAD